MKKIALVVLLLSFMVIMSGCTAFIQRDLTVAITPDNQEYPDRKSYIRLTRLDKNP